MIKKSTAFKAALPLVVIMILLLASAGGKEAAGATPSLDRAPGTGSVDILFLNHPPVRTVLLNVDRLLAGYCDKLIVTRYDFDSPEGAAFAKKKSLAGHIPLVIFINGSHTFKLGNRTVIFQSFPKGEGPGMVADGEWAIADLDVALTAAIRK